MKKPFYIYDHAEQGYFIEPGEGYTENRAHAYPYFKLPSYALADDGSMYAHLEIKFLTDKEISFLQKAGLSKEVQLTMALSAALEWIDAVPKDIVLPTMPGFDRDWVDSLLDEVE